MNKTVSGLLCASIVGALSLALGGESAAAGPADNTPELNYLRGCIAATLEWKAKAAADAKGAPLSCDDLRVPVAKPTTVSSSSVWIYGAAPLIDVALSDRSHLRFDGQQIAVAPAFSAPVLPQARMRAETTCGPSRCCTDGGYCCNWATGGSPICGYGR